MPAIGLLFFFYQLKILSSVKDSSMLRQTLVGVHIGVNMTLFPKNHLGNTSYRLRLLYHLCKHTDTKELLPHHLSIMLKCPVHLFVCQSHFCVILIQQVTFVPLNTLISL